jgi:rubredoxin
LSKFSTQAQLIVGVLPNQYLEKVVRKWQCLVCSFVYEEALGLPDDGIPAGTSWDDIPDDWACPECGVGKEDFEMIEI